MTECANQQIDPFLCTCGPCKRFWRNTFHSSVDYLQQNAEDRSDQSATLSRLQPHAMISLGDRVAVQDKPGVVKFIGFVDENTVAPLLMIGVKLDECVHLGHDGTYNGKRYFFCTKGHGVLVRYADVVPLKAPNKRPPVKGNPMFPSWPEICKRRKQREAMIEETYRKNSRRPSPGSSTKTPRPPAISPRDNRTQMLRQETTPGKGQRSEPYLVIQDDPSDVAIKDQKQRKKKERLVASLASKDSPQVSWEKGLVQQWRRKYDDPEKASRMGETLMKLCSAYKEGMKFRSLHTD
ncbi:uncharacterized protein LOC143285453 isoform X2 [Babylonia areolata]|uniref:uncharacterized protein LOC143285453 isoform X2 n=1 Tax=Babylonia areolata TaxID=304850 RepID=UPI003FCFD88A